MTTTNANLDQLRDDYGDELIDGIMKATAEQANQAAAAANQGNFNTKKEMLSQRLSRRNINFEQTNNDPLFHEWLGKFDPNTGAQRQGALTQAFNNGDFDTAEKMFLDYKMSDGGAMPAENGSNNTMASSFGREPQRESMSELKSAHTQLLHQRKRAQDLGDSAHLGQIQAQMNAIVNKMQMAR